MKILNKKILRDIKLNKSQFATIFLMVFLGVFVFSGIHAYMDGMKISGDNYYEKNNLEDICISGENFTKDDLEAVRKLDNVRDAERVLTITTNLENYEDVTLEANFIESNNISEMYIVAGEKFSINKQGVWLDAYLAKNLEIEVGDEIIISYKNYEITEKVLGLVLTPNHVYSVKSENEIFPTHKDYGYVYLSINEFPMDYIYDEIRKETGIAYNEIIDMYDLIMPGFNLDETYVFNNILVDVVDTSKIEDTKKDIENNIEAAQAVIDRDSFTSCEGFNSEIEEGSTYSSVFTLLFLFIAILSVITTMNRFVKKQRTQIGTLKALGVKNKKIIIHYVSYGFFISLLAAICGIIVGKLFLGSLFINMEMEYFEIPEYDTVLLPIVYILAILVVLLITFVTYLSCRKFLKESAVEALRIEVPKVNISKFDITNSKIFKRFSISTRWNLRDVARNKARSLTAIIGVAGCTMLLVCAFGMLDTMNSYLEWEFDKLCNFKYKISLDYDIEDKDLEKVLSKYGSFTSQSVGIEIQRGDKKETNQLTINDAKDYLKYTNHDREYIELSSDGVYITEKLSETLNLKVGDAITWHIFGEDQWYTTPIVGLNRDPQSQILNMTREYFESLGCEYEPDSIYTNEDLSNIENLDSGIEGIQSKNALRQGMQSMLETMKTMIVLLIVVSAILGLVIIYNLGILSFTEKQYQFATLKVLGFKSKQIKKIFTKQNSWLTIIAIVVGLILGFYMTDFIFKSALGDNYDFDAQIKIISYIYAIIGTFIVSKFVNRKLAKKVETIDMVSSLKGNE